MGSVVVRRLVAQAAAICSPAGMLIFEFGLGQDDAVEELISTGGRPQTGRPARDLQGIPADRDRGTTCNGLETAVHA